MMQFPFDRYFLFTRATVLVVLIAVPFASANATTIHLVPELGFLVPEAENFSGYAPHHLDGGSPTHLPGDPTHYFAPTGDAHHFTWADRIPGTGVIDVYYDFRSANGFNNNITPGQQTLAVRALDLWSEVSNLNFIQNTGVVTSEIINIGTGDLAAFGFVSGIGGTLALGGGIFTHSTHSITEGVAWMDIAENWDETFSNGDPAGTFDWFTVAAQEIGHALGLGHTDNIGSLDIMNEFYSIEKIALSANDINHITSIYGNATVVPIPPTVLLFGSGMFVLLGFGLRGKT